MPSPSFGAAPGCGRLYFLLMESGEFRADPVPDAGLESGPTEASA
jgi:hypothetical protein